MINKFKKNMTISYMTLPGLRNNYKFHLYDSGDKAGLIEEVVCEEYKVSISDLRSKSRLADLCLPRNICMFLMRRYTNLTIRTIGERFNRHYTSVIHAAETAADLMQTDSKIRETVNAIETKIH